MSVDRCICHNVTFRALLELARTMGADLDKLAEATGCGTACGMCVPYVKVSLKTGKPRLPVLTDQQIADILDERATV